MKAAARALWLRIAQRSVTGLTRVACVLALLGLVIMMYPLLFPGALTVVLSMALGHTLGMTAFVCYLLAIVLDLAQRRAN
jgi:hypothetical protein